MDLDTWNTSSEETKQSCQGSDGGGGGGGGGGVGGEMGGGAVRNKFGLQWKRRVVSSVNCHHFRCEILSTRVAKAHFFEKEHWYEKHNVPENMLFTFII